jgi:RNA polymerase sigma factor (sigma-70 family)
MQFPITPLNLLTKLRAQERDPGWEVSWKRFLELYHAPIATIAHSCYRHHTGGHEPSPALIEDIVAITIAEFFSKGQHRYDASKGKLRTYLRMLINARVVDLLRKERPLNQRDLPEDLEAPAPIETASEQAAIHKSLLATMIEDLRNRIPMRQFEIFERVKLKHQSPQFVAEEFGIKREMVDRYIYKAMTTLREIASQDEYQQEFNP